MVLQTCLSLICNDGVQFLMEIRKISRRRPRSVDDAELGHFTLIVFQRTAKKWTKIYNARTQPLYCSLNLLFSDVLVAVVVVVSLSSLLILRERQSNNDGSQTDNLSSSRREINFLLTRMIGHPPSYEEVTTNDDNNDATTQTQCVAPPCYTDEEQETDTNPSPPSYESVALRTLNKWSVKCYLKNTRQCLYKV